jgi:hypothetical protein
VSFQEMSFKEKNIVVTLFNFCLILIFYLININNMLVSNTFTPDNVFRLFGWVIFLSVVVTVIAIMATHLLPIWWNHQQGNKRKPDEPLMDDFEDERDESIDLRGTRITYTITSLGSFVAMLTYVFGQPPLTMFTLLIFFGLLAQIVGDVTRLRLYQKGF